MIGYSDLYELARKEKYSEALQPLPKNFIEDFSDFVKSSIDTTKSEVGFLADAAMKTNKQLENSLSIFKELVLRRKRKILTLVFVATETGLMKKDYENMLAFEKEMFDKMVRTFEEGDKKLEQILKGSTSKEEKSKMILFREDVDLFMDQNGKEIGPFKKGDLSNLDFEVAQILVSGEKATFVDEDH